VTGQGHVDFDSFRETIFRRRLASGIEVKVTREGLFAFGFDTWAPGQFPVIETSDPQHFEALASTILNRTLVMNSFLAFLYTNEVVLDRFAHDRMVVTPELVISMRNLDSIDMGFGNQTVSYLALSSFPTTYVPHLPPSMDSRIRMRGTPISVNVVEKSADDLSNLMQAEEADGLQLVDLFLKASKSYQDHNHSLAVIMNWAITEKLIQELWRNYQADNQQRDGKPFITGERRKRLLDGRSFTASVITEILSFAGYIDYDLYSDISKVRKIRNDWMHSLVSTISSTDATRAASVASRLLEQLRGIELQGSGGLRLHR
jgi:hypothetical protein